MSVEEIYLRLKNDKSPAFGWSAVDYETALQYAKVEGQKGGFVPSTVGYFVLDVDQLYGDPIRAGDGDKQHELIADGVAKVVHEFDGAFSHGSSTKGRRHIFIPCEVAPYEKGGQTALRHTQSHQWSKHGVGGELRYDSGYIAFGSVAAMEMLREHLNTRDKVYTTEDIDAWLDECCAPAKPVEAHITRFNGIYDLKGITPRTTADMTVNGAVRAVLQAEEGERNKTLHEMARGLALQGKLSTAAADKLLKAGVDNGMDIRECQRTINSAAQFAHKVKHEKVELDDDGEVVQKGVPFSDRELGEYTVEHDPNWYYRNELGKHWSFNASTRRYAEINNPMTRASDIFGAKDRPDLTKAQYISARTTRKVNAVLTWIADNRKVQHDRFDTHAHLLNTPDGVVDLRDGSMREGAPEDFLTLSTAVAPDSKTPELWLNALETWLNGDGDTIEYLQLAWGQALFGRVCEHIVLILDGEGGNGKSVCLNTLLYVLGDYGGAVSSSLFAGKHMTEGDKSQLASVRGKRLIVSSEKPSSHGRLTLKAEQIKSICSGDPITAKFMRRDPFVFTPQCNVVMAFNGTPTSSVDRSIHRRIRVIPFEARIGGVKGCPIDVNLDAKLREEAGGILQWLIDGAVRYERDIFNGDRSLDSFKSKMVQTRTNEYFSWGDSVGEFIADQCEIDPDCREPFSRVFKEYLNFCELQWVDPVARNTFGRSLTAADPRAKVERVNNRSTVIGLRLTSFNIRPRESDDREGDDPYNEVPLPIDESDY